MTFPVAAPCQPRGRTAVSAACSCSAWPHREVPRVVHARDGSTPLHASREVGLRVAYTYRCRRALRRTPPVPDPRALSSSSCPPTTYKPGSPSLSASAWSFVATACSSTWSTFGGTTPWFEPGARQQAAGGTMGWLIEWAKILRLPPYEGAYPVRPGMSRCGCPTPKTYTQAVWRPGGCKSACGACRDVWLELG
jgi:hypothetical protein